MSPSARQYRWRALWLGSYMSDHTYTSAWRSSARMALNCRVVALPPSSAVLRPRRLQASHEFAMRNSSMAIMYLRGASRSWTRRACLAGAQELVHILSGAYGIVPAPEHF